MLHHFALTGFMWTVGLKRYFIPKMSRHVAILQSAFRVHSDQASHYFSSEIFGGRNPEEHGL